MRSRTTHPLIAVGAEQASVVAFLHHDVSDAGLILLLKADTGLPDGQQLIIQHLRWKSTNFKFIQIQTVAVCQHFIVLFSLPEALSLINVPSLVALNHQY